jgi:hypothetical protein
MSFSSCTQVHNADDFLKNAFHLLPNFSISTYCSLSLHQ